MNSRRSRKGRDQAIPPLAGLSKGPDTERTYVDGDCIVAEGSSGREMFIIAAGRVRIAKAIPDGHLTLGYVERGDFFGEMSLLESLPRYASAFAVGETRVVVIEPGSLLLRVRHDPSLALEMLKRLSTRLRGANSRLMDALEQAESRQPDVPVWEPFEHDAVESD
jgi:CRP-like cAMP-binding protein